MDTIAIKASLCLLLFKTINASMIEMGMILCSSTPSPMPLMPKIPHFQSMCTIFKALYTDADKLEFTATHGNIHNFLLILGQTKKDSVTLIKTYRKFYEANKKPDAYTYLIDIFKHTHKVLELISFAVDDLLRIEDTEEYSKPLQEFYTKANIDWREPLETLTYVIYDHITQVNQHHNLDPDDLVLCARLQRVLAQSPGRFAGYALDYD